MTETNWKALSTQLKGSLNDSILTFVDFPVSYDCPENDTECEEYCRKLYDLGIDVVVPKHGENKIGVNCLKNVRKVANDFNLHHEDRRVYVAGCLELDGDFGQSIFDFDVTANILKDLIVTLLGLGIDILLFRSIKNTCVAKAAIYALEELRSSEEFSGIENIPIVLSCTVDMNGRLPCNQSFDAFVTSIRHGEPLSVGLECVNLTKALTTLRSMESNSDIYTSCEITLDKMLVTKDENFAALSYANILMITGDINIENLKIFLGRFQSTRKKPRKPIPDKYKKCLKLAGGELLIMKDGNGFENLLKIGEDCDVPNVPSFRKIILGMAELNDDISETLKDIQPVAEGKYKYAFFGIDFLLKQVGKQATNNLETFQANMEKIEEIQKLQDEALQMASDQVALGADALNILFDPISYVTNDELPLAKLWMKWFVQLIESPHGTKISSRLAQIPLCIDSRNVDIILEGMKYSKGKPIANAISLDKGEEKFKNDAKAIKRLGPAAVVALALLESGPAKSVEEKVKTCVKMYNILVHDVGFSPNEIILDPVVPRTASMPCIDYGWTFIEATKRIRAELGNVTITGGISCVSQVFRSESSLRPEMNKVFLQHCMEVGMQTAIMNVKNLTDETKKILMNNLITNKDPDAAQKLKEFYHALEG